MIHHSFIHIPSIGAVTERKIWAHGITTMDDFLEAAPEFFSTNKRKIINDFISLSKLHLNNHDSMFFLRHLPTNEHWRIFKEFQGKTAYLDIETTGLDSWDNMITTIALYDGKNIRYYVNGMNLEHFQDDILEFDVIVTYNGKTFDIPFIERYFGIRLNQAQLDLRYILHSLGYGGGLKSCEKQMGIGRTGTLACMDGFFAVVLWDHYQRTGNEKYLETLLSYNIEDALNLEYLMISAYNMKLNRLPISIETMEMPVSPENPFGVDAVIIDKIQGQYFK